MQCSCGVTNVPNAKFCKGCGKGIQKVPNIASEGNKSCLSCHTNLKPESKFCGKCGYRFAEQTVESTPLISTDEQSFEQPLDTKGYRIAEHVCPSCNVEMKLGAKFCGHCGQSPEPLVEAPSDKPSASSIEPSIQSQTSEAAESSSPTIVAVTPAVKGVSKKMLITIAVSLCVVAGAVLAWFSLREPSTTTASVIHADNAAAVSATPDVAKLELAQKPVSVPVPAVPATPVKVAPSLVSKYIGQTIKNGAKLGQYDVVLLGQSGGFKVLSAYGGDDEGMLSYTKIVLVTDQDGRVFDSKDVPENYRMLVDGKSACVINQKPYPGIYALSSMESKLTTPAAVWILNDSGKLVNQDAKGVQCGVYVEFMPESDVLKDIVGYNDLHKLKPANSAPAKAKIKDNPLKSSPSNTATKTASQKTDKKVIAPIEHQQAASTHTEQQEPVNQDEPQKKQGSFFEKLGESVKKGATERVCSSAERAMGQCN